MWPTKLHYLPAWGGSTNNTAYLHNRLIVSIIVVLLPLLVLPTNIAKISAKQHTLTEFLFGSLKYRCKIYSVILVFRPRSLLETYIVISFKRHNIHLGTSIYGTLKTRLVAIYLLSMYLGFLKCNRDRTVSII